MGYPLTAKITDIALNAFVLIGKLMESFYFTLIANQLTHLNSMVF